MAETAIEEPFTLSGEDSPSRKTTPHAGPPPESLQGDESPRSSSGLDNQESPTAKSENDEAKSAKLDAAPDDSQEASRISAERSNQTTRPNKHAERLHSYLQNAIRSRSGPQVHEPSGTYLDPDTGLYMYHPGLFRQHHIRSRHYPSSTNPFVLRRGPEESHIPRAIHLTRQEEDLALIDRVLHEYALRRMMGDLSRPEVEVFHDLIRRFVEDPYPIVGIEALQERFEGRPMAGFVSYLMEPIAEALIGDLLNASGGTSLRNRENAVDLVREASRRR